MGGISPFQISPFTFLPSPRRPESCQLSFPVGPVLRTEADLLSQTSGKGHLLLGSPIALTLGHGEWQKPELLLVIYFTHPFPP